MPVKYETINARELRDGDVILPWHIDQDETLADSQGRLEVIPNGIAQRPRPPARDGGEPEYDLIAKVLPVGSGLPPERAGEMVYSDPEQHVKIQPRRTR